MEAAQLATNITPANKPADQITYIVDERGYVITYPDETIAALSDLSTTAPVMALRANDATTGALIFGDIPNNRIAGFALVPDIGWGVIIERPVAGALAGLRSGREMAFGGLVLVIAIAMITGMILARRLNAPLSTLARAASRLAEGDATAPLPQDNTTEVMQLTTAFQQMREQLIEAATDREQAIQMRDSFFSIAAHELKTPLTALMGHAELLQRRANQAGILADRDQRALTMVITQSHRLNKLITDLLDVSRLHQGRLALECTTLDLNTLVERVITELQPTLVRHSIEQVAWPEPLYASIDALRIEQVLHNLISNAVKYSPAGGKIEIVINHQGSMACVAVTDQGIGIPPDAMPNLFQQFYRATNASSKHISGMGIGLYVVQEIIALHNGRVGVESVEGQGSTFRIWLPLTHLIAPMVCHSAKTVLHEVS